jgi:hypothetical protein
MHSDACSVPVAFYAGHFWDGLSGGALGVRADGGHAHICLRESGAFVLQ